MIRSSVVAVLLLRAAQLAHADSAVSSSLPPALPGVTLELCNDLDIDEVQQAVELELDGSADPETEVRITCDGNLATVSVVGPMHPKGRIVDVDLAEVTVPARSRTVALIAAELWTAPEPAPRPRFAAKPKPSRGQERWSDPRRRWQITAGLALVSRDTYSKNVSQETGLIDHTLHSSTSRQYRFGASGPVLPWLGVFATLDLGAFAKYSGHNSPQGHVRTDRFDIGVFVPIRKTGRLRLDIRASLGEESSETKDFFEGERTLEAPRRSYAVVGLDGMYHLGGPWALRARVDHVSAERVRNFDHSEESTSTPVGVRWGGSATYLRTNSLLFEASIETASLRPGYRSSTYFDNTTTARIDLRYLFF